MFSVLIAESGHSGHVFVYVAELARHALNEGYKVTLLVSKDGLRSPEYSRHLADVEAVDVRCSVADMTLGDVAAASLAADSDLAIVPNGDVHLLELVRYGWKGRGKLRIVVMRDPRWETATTPSRWIQLRTKRLAIGLANARGADVFWLRQPGYAGPEKHANDPVIIQRPLSEVIARGVQLRESMAMDPDVYWFGMTGSISTHKNLPLVFDALRILGQSASEARFGFALIGPLSASMDVSENDIAEQFRTMPFPTRRRSDIMTNEEMNDVVAALDCVIMAYSTSSPNSTLAKAATLGTSVAAAGDQSIARFVADLGMGPTSSLSSSALAVLLRKRLGSPNPRPREDLLVNQFQEVLLALDT